MTRSWIRLSKEGSPSAEYFLDHKTIFKIGNSVMYMAKRLKKGNGLEIESTRAKAMMYDLVYLGTIAWMPSLAATCA